MRATSSGPKSATQPFKVAATSGGIGGNSAIPGSAARSEQPLHLHGEALAEQGLLREAAGERLDLAGVPAVEGREGAGVVHAGRRPDVPAVTDVTDLTGRGSGRRHRPGASPVSANADGPAASAGSAGQPGPHQVGDCVQPAHRPEPVAGFAAGAGRRRR